MNVVNIASLSAKKDFSHLRLVILDYPKKLLNNEMAKSILADVLTARQIGYQKASETYISIDKLDMIGTHILVCDVSNIYKPKVISGLRLSYNDRCERHDVDLPMDVNIKYSSKETQNVYNLFKANNKCLVESNALFVDSNYSYSKTKIDLSQIMMTGVVSYILRSGNSNFITATNEKFKTSRWVDFGSYPDGHLFVHPLMPDDHKVILVNSFYMDIMAERFHNLDHFLNQAYEIVPDDMKLKTHDAIYQEVITASKVKKVA
jgi:hypothetical protein